MKTMALLSVAAPLAALGLAHAKDANSSGGGALHVCRDPKTGAIEKLELLDLYRGRTELRLEIPETDLSADEQFEAAARRLEPHDGFLPRFRQARERMEQSIQSSDAGLALNGTGDTGPARPEPGCAIEQLAAYTPAGTLLVQPELYAELRKRPGQAAAFRMHEILYRIAKRDGAPDSQQVQKVVARLFAATEDRRAIDGALRDAKLVDPECDTFANEASPRDSSPLKVRVQPAFYGTCGVVSVDLRTRSGNVIRVGAVELADQVSRVFRWSWQDHPSHARLKGVEFVLPIATEDLAGATIVAEPIGGCGFVEVGVTVDHSVKLELRQGRNRIASWNGRCGLRGKSRDVFTIR